MDADEVRNLIAEHLAVPASCVHDAARFDALGADSLDLVELAMRLEDRFDCAISEEEAEGCYCVADVVRLVTAKRVAATPMAMAV